MPELTKDAWWKLLMNEVNLLAEKLHDELGVAVQVVVSYAVPRPGTRYAARLTCLQPAVKKLPPINLWSGIVNERTFVRPKDARCGIIGLTKLGFERKGEMR
jgi:hypothetical protein